MPIRSTHRQTDRQTEKDIQINRPLYTNQIREFAIKKEAQVLVFFCFFFVFFAPSIHYVIA